MFAHPRSPATQMTPAHTAPAALRRPPIQAKLTVSQPGDLHEREADAAADQVMAMQGGGFTTPAATAIQRACSSCAGPDELQRAPALTAAASQVSRFTMNEVAEGRVFDDAEPVATGSAAGPVAAPSDDEPAAAVQRVAAGAAGGSGVASAGSPVAASVGARQPRPDIAGAIDRAAGGGQPLPDAARSFMEPRFGHDFGAVRIHADRAAGELAGQLQARAFTTGHDVFFAPGEFQPGAAGGQRLLAHELAHVVQQSQGAPGVDRQIQRTGNGCANCQAYCGYDTPRDLTTYNCAGLAHRNYTYMQVPAILAAYAGNGTFASGGACSAPGIVQHWLWEFDIRMEDASGKVVVPTWQDFHTVAGPTPGDPVPYSSDEVYSKNGRRPVYGPGTGPGFRPAARSVATTNDPAETPLTDPASGAPLYKVRSNIVETRACLPCPRATP